MTKGGQVIQKLIEQRHWHTDWRQTDLRLCFWAVAQAKRQDAPGHQYFKELLRE